MRVVVIGAGIVGAHVAAALARRGADVTLVERAEPGGGTSGGSFAWIDASHPGLARYLELRLLGLQAWRRQAEEYGRPAWLSLPGTMMWTSSSEAADELDRHARVLDDHGERPQRLSPRDALRLEPDLLVAPDLETLYLFRGEGWVLTGPAITAILDRGRAAGLRLRTHAAVTALTFDSLGCVSGVVLADGHELHGDVVVSCVGRWTESLLAQTGAEVPMVSPEQHSPPSLGLVVRTTPSRGRIGRVIKADGLLMRPEPGDRLLLHSEAHDTRLQDEAVPPALPEKLIRLLAQRLRGVGQIQAEDARICVRALPADLLPVVGPALDGLYVVATHSGVTLAPVLADLIVDELVDQRDSAVLERFRPRRFGRQAA